MMDPTARVTESEVMRTRSRFSILWIALLLVIPSVGWAQTFEAYISQVDKNNFPTISLYIDVVDRTSRPIKGLARSHFKVFEDGRLVEVVSFTDPSTPRLLTTVLVLDRSGSMQQGSKLQALKAAASNYIRSMRETDQTSIITFSDRVQELQPLTSRKDLLQQSLDSIQAAGQTAFFDAVYEGLQVAGRVQGRRVILAMTDGIDNKSWKPPEKVMDLAVRYGIPIYTIGLGARSKGAAGEDGINEQVLRYLAERSGGLYFYAPSAGELANIYEILARRFQAGYELTYISPRKVEDGTRRAVSLTVVSEMGTVQTTNSYYVPGVIVPSGDAYLFIGLLIPLILLMFAPTVMQRIGLARIAVTKSWVLRIFQRGMTIFAQKNKVKKYHAEEEILYLVPLTKNSSLQPFPLRKADNFIGFNTDNDLVIPHPSVSPKHACIRWEENGYVICDLDSKAGTFVSYSGDLSQERQIGKSALKNGSRVRLGEVYWGVSERFHNQSVRSQIS